MGKREDILRIREAAENAIRVVVFGHDDDAITIIQNEDCQVMWIAEDGTLTIYSNDDIKNKLNWNELLSSEVLLPDIQADDSIRRMIKCVTVQETIAGVRFTVPFNNNDDNNKEATPTTPTSISGWIVFLRTSDFAWKCISVAISVGNSDEGEGASYTEMRNLREMTWGKISTIFDDNEEDEDDDGDDAEKKMDKTPPPIGYRLANRACRGDEMKRVLHPVAFRLSEVHYNDATTTDAENGTIQITDCNTFCNEFVSKRYTNTESVHYHAKVAYTESKSTVPFEMYAASMDTMIAGEFAAPNLAMVTCKIGHPPAVWTDLLTCAKVKIETNNGGSTDTVWQIIQKSSTRQSFPPPTEIYSTK